MTRADKVPHVGECNASNQNERNGPHVGDLYREAVLALTTLGFKKPDAVATLARAATPSTPTRRSRRSFEPRCASARADVAAAP